MARPASGRTMLPRSIRVEQGIWNKAKQRAESEGTTASTAAAELLEGYARGVYDLPRTRTVREFPSAK